MNDKDEVLHSNLMILMNEDHKEQDQQLPISELKHRAFLYHINITIRINRKTFSGGRSQYPERPSR